MGAFEAGTTIAGRYRLDRPLAKGGMGCVWVARHLQLDVDVAIKLMTAQLADSAEGRMRFEREAKASALLRVANAVNVLDYGVEDGAPFIVMEMLDGEDLQAKLDRVERLTLEATLGILEQVARALRRAHEIGLVHRDLKPANLFLARQSGEEIVKVLDFGIAKLTGPETGAGATRTGALLGSPHYMSPEQVRSTNRVDHRTDLWALGVIAYRCVTGQLPIPGHEVGQVLVDVCTKPIAPPSTIAPDLAPEVDRFFERALMRDPAQRFQHVDELVAAFSTLLRPGAPFPATGPTPFPVIQGAPPAAGTLSPSIHTETRPPKQSVLPVVAVALSSLLVIAAALFALLHTPAQPGPPRAEPAAAPAQSAAPAAVAPPASSASATAAPSAPASAPVVAPSATATPRHTPGHTPRKKDDLLDHM
jgi:eukaryotic-like serine/threonine-protein kinase